MSPHNARVNQQRPLQRVFPRVPKHPQGPVTDSKFEASGMSAATSALEDEEEAFLGWEGLGMRPPPGGILRVAPCVYWTCSGDYAEILGLDAVLSLG